MNVLILCFRQISGFHLYLELPSVCDSRYCSGFRPLYSNPSSQVLMLPSGLPITGLSNLYKECLENVFMEMKFRDIVQCPKCGFRFSKSYSRITSCKGCPQSAGQCGLIRCPKCSHEFQG